MDASDRGASPASELDGSYPRPQLVRTTWADLGGVWEFAFDDADPRRSLSRAAQDRTAAVFARSITVPFPPESAASGVADTGFHPVVWYRREVNQSDLDAAGLGTQGSRVILHFAAVDYQADVWLADQFLGRHEGGSTPFAFDITHVVGRTTDPWDLVVRAQDDPHDLAQPRGKQDWQLEPHRIWYARTTGIWQPVWLEAVPESYVESLRWSSDVPAGTVELTLELDSRPSEPAWVTVVLRLGQETLADVRFRQGEPRSRTVISVPRLANGQAYESLLWSPDAPRLVDAFVTVAFRDGVGDEVRSYLGIRSVGWDDGHFMLNDRPCYLRAVLEQGYWPESNLAAPSAAALRDEAQLIKDLGFNSVRIHQKVEDPRFLYWTDRLGVLVWGENASAYEFSATAVERLTREWIEVIARDVSHPSIIVWVPLNESWGVQHIARDPAQLDYARSLYHLTKALDPSRPVISNDGWEHADSDLWTIHDYGGSRSELAANYADRHAVEELLSGVGPLGRRIKVVDSPDRGQPVVVSEFGGISFAPIHDGGAWGYVAVAEAAHFETLLRDLFEALQASPVLAGFCYTQLTDTRQEANGLTDPHRRAKLPVQTIRSIVHGAGLDTSWQRRPKRPVARLSVSASSDLPGPTRQR